MVSPTLQDAERGGGGLGQPASLLTRSAGLLRPSLPDAAGGAAAQDLHSLPCHLPPHRLLFFWGGCFGEGTEPDAFDRHVFSLSCRGWRAGAR